MSTIAPLGTALLDCNATIENPRASSEDSDDLSLIFDALILCYDEETEANTPTTVCSVRHKRASRKRNTSRRRISSSLDSMGLLCFAVHLDANKSWKRQLVAFRENIHPASPMRPDSELTFMGDILQV